ASWANNTATIIAGGKFTVGQTVSISGITTDSNNSPHAYEGNHQITSIVTDSAGKRVGFTYDLTPNPGTIIFLQGAVTTSPTVLREVQVTHGTRSLNNPGGIVLDSATGTAYV